MNFLRNLVKNGRTESREAFIRDQNTNLKSKREEYLIKSNTSSGFYPHKNNNLRYSNLPSNNTHSPLRFIKSQRKNTPSQFEVSAKKFQTDVLKTRSPSFQRNMGHVKQNPKTLIIKKNTGNQRIQRKKEFYESNRSFSNNYGIELNNLESFEESDEDRMKGNGFINIPKVKTNYKKLYNPSKQKFKMFSTTEYKSKRNNIYQYDTPLRARVSPLLHSRRQPSQISMNSILKTRQSRVPSSQHSFTNSIHRFDNSPNISHISKLEDSMKLDFDVFEGENIYEKRKLQSIHSMSNISKLSSKIQISSGKRQNKRIEKVRGKKYMKSMFDIRNEMSSKQQVVPVSQENQRSHL